MMDFGFGVFLEKFEEHFGKTALKGLLLLIGMAVALFCAKMIWEIGLGPLVDAITKAGLTKTLLNLFWMGAAFAFGVAVSSALYIAFMTWRLNHRLTESEKLADLHLERIDRIEAELDALLENDKPA